MAKSKYETFQGNAVKQELYSGFWSKIEDKKILFLSDKEKEDNTTFKRFIEAPSVYMYRNSKTGAYYVGQAKNVFERNKGHWGAKNSTDAKRFSTHVFDEIVVVYSPLLNDSASSLDYLENRLIQFFNTDNPKKNTNGTDGNKTGQFKDRIDIDTKLILPFWKNELNQKRKWVKEGDIDKLRKSALYKWSCFKSPTPEQKKIIEKIINNPDTNFVVQGIAGTGKTIIVNNLVASLIDQSEGKKKIAVVCDGNWKGYANDIFKVYTNHNDKNSALVFGTSTEIINGTHKLNAYDYIIVDESHKLSRRYGKQQGVMNKVYKRKEFKDCQSHLEILQKLGKQIILMYDIFQAVRPSNITRDEYARLTKDYEYLALKHQMRIKDFENKSYTPDDYINGLKYLLYKDTDLLKLDRTYNKDFNRDVFRDMSESAYFSIYDGDEPLADAYNFVKNDFMPDHTNRILASMIFDDDVASKKYVLKYSTKKANEKDSKGYCKKKHWNEGDLHLPWNSTYKAWLKIKDKDKEDQIGCVYAVQGVDLDRAAVLICPDLKIKDGKLYADPDVMNNPNLVFKAKERKSMQEEFNILIFSQYFVLLTRAASQVRVGFWKNKDFLEYMKKTLEIE